MQSYAYHCHRPKKRSLFKSISGYLLLLTVLALMYFAYQDGNFIEEYSTSRLHSTWAYWRAGVFALLIFTRCAFEKRARLFVIVPVMLAALYGSFFGVDIGIDGLTIGHNAAMIVLLLVLAYLPALSFIEEIKPWQAALSAIPLGFIGLFVSYILGMLFWLAAWCVYTFVLMFS